MPGAGARSLSILLALLTLSPLIAGKAFGVTAPGPVEVLCDGDCVGPAVTDLVPSDEPLDFELGLRITGSGLDLSIRSEGSVFLRSPIRATDSIRLVGGRDIRIGSGAVLSSDGGSIDLRAGDVLFEEPSLVRPPSSGGGVIVIGDPDRAIEAPRLPVIELPRAPVCACITIAGSNLTLPRVSSGSLSVLSGSLVPLAPGYAVSRAGDLYIDLSGVVLASLDVDAKRDLYLDGTGAIPTPEPASAMLIGFGLAALAGRRGAQ